jgi:hypothetical protein
VLAVGGRMPPVEAPSMELVDSVRFRSRSQLEEAYDLFRLEKQGALLAGATLDFYDLHVGAFMRPTSRSQATDE